MMETSNEKHDISKIPICHSYTHRNDTKSSIYFSLRLTKYTNNDGKRLKIIHGVLRLDRW